MRRGKQQLVVIAAVESKGKINRTVLLTISQLPELRQLDLTSTAIPVASLASCHFPKLVRLTWWRSDWAVQHRNTIVDFCNRNNIEFE